MIEVREIFLDNGHMFSDSRYCITGTKTPHFSWAVVSDQDNDVQTAFDAVVRCGDAVLWHSGWTETAEQSVTYAGKPLPPGRYLDFYVKVRGMKGETSDAFGGQFICGAMKEDAWKGKWITADADNGESAVYFRREFKLEKSVASACLFVSGIGYHQVTINGMKIDEARLDPAFSDYNRTCYYAVLPDVAEALEQGENAIGIVVANGWRRCRDPQLTEVCGGKEPELFGKPALNAMLLVYYADNTRQCLYTDDRWTWKFGAVTQAHIFNGETYDAAASDPLWDQPNLPEEEITGFSSVAVDTDAPTGVLRPMTLEPIRERETYDPIAVTEPERGVFIADFGQNLAGVIKLLLPERMKAGSKITIRYAEELDEQGNLFTAPLRQAAQTDTYLASGDSRDLVMFQPQFTYHGFRYAEVRGIPLFDRHCIQAIALYTDIKNESMFRCGSPVVNAIQDMVVKTEKANLYSICTDCPQRNERMAWMNDATVRFEETPYNFDIGRLFPKIIHDIMDTQREDGAFACCSPYVSFGQFPADPVCSSFLIAGKEAYYHTGNRQILAEAFDSFAAWEDCLLAHSDDYIVNYSYYGDWAGPAYACTSPEGAQSSVTEGIFMSTGYSYYNCRLLVEFAEILGRTEDRDRYQALAEKIQAAFLAKWWNPETCVVGTGSEGCFAFALYIGILPEEKRQKAADLMRADLVLRGDAFTTGNLTTRYLLDMLTKYGYIEDAWRVLTKESYPSFGYMLQNEATTVWERFELKQDPGMNSHCHPMYGAVGSWFYAYLCGIVPTGAGFSTVSIHPYYPEKLLSAQASVDTVKGALSVRWTRRYGKTQLFVQIPFGVSAEITVGEELVRCGSGFHRFTF